MRIMGQEPTEPTTPAEPTEPVTEPTAPAEPKVFDEDYVKKLRAEAAGNRTKATELERRLQEIEDRDKSETEKAAARAEKAEKSAQEAQAQLMRYEVAKDKGLDAKFVDLLTGSTKDEMAQVADRLLELATPETPPFDGGARPPAPPNEDPAKAHNELLMQALGRGRQQ